MFQNYLVGHKTNYIWNLFSSSSLNVDIRVGQGLALSSILSALYITSILHIFENQLKSLKIPISFLFFVNDGLLVTQNKNFLISNSLLFCGYQIISSPLEKFRLKLEHEKTKVFHFSRSTSLFNLPPLNLSLLDSPILRPKNSQKYLGFIFGRKLLF